MLHQATSPRGRVSDISSGASRPVRLSVPRSLPRKLLHLAESPTVESSTSLLLRLRTRIGSPVHIALCGTGESNPDPLLGRQMRSHYASTTWRSPCPVLKADAPKLPDPTHSHAFPVRIRRFVGTVSGSPIWVLGYYPLGRWSCTPQKLTAVNFRADSRCLARPTTNLDPLV